jgi:hypothetical protein
VQIAIMDGGKMKISDNPILIHFEIGKLSISFFRCWLGFGYADFKSMGKRLNFGFIKFWLD